MIVVLTDTAIADPIAIGQFIQTDNPQRAETFVAQLEVRCHQLGSMPRAFPLVPRYEDHGVRRRPYHDYLIFYRIAADRVEILHVLHGARDYERILFPDR